MADIGDGFAEAFAAATADEDYFGAAGPCPIAVEPGNRRFVLVTGQNASGKSFLAKVVQSHLRNDCPKVEWMGISMAKRTESGIVRALMFGDEGRESTGRISTDVVLTGISTCRGRDNAHVLSLDEPDYGLSDAYQSALGDVLASFARDLPEKTEGFLLVTHSRKLVERLLPLTPTLVRVGDDLRPTKRWLEEGDYPKSVADLESLGSTSTARYRRIAAIVADRQATRTSAPRR